MGCEDRISETFLWDCYLGPSCRVQRGHSWQSGQSAAGQEAKAHRPHSSACCRQAVVTLLTGDLGFLDGVCRGGTGTEEALQGSGCPSPSSQARYWVGLEPLLGLPLHHLPALLSGPQAGEWRPSMAD